MARKSIVEIRNSDVRLKTRSSQYGVRDSTGRKFIGSQRTSLMQTRNRKRQKRLFEYNIPTTSSPPIRKRNQNGTVINLKDDPITIDEENSDMESKEKDDVDDDLEVLEIDTFPAETEDERIEILDDCIPLTTVDNRNEETINSIENKDDVSNDEDIITCPICNHDLSNFELYEKEAHCESCLERLNENEVPLERSKIKCSSTIIESGGQIDQATSTISSTQAIHMKSTSKPKQSGTSKKKSPPKPKKQLPRIKILKFNDGYKIVVDGFNFAPDEDISKYFLSHFHSDHYIGLKKSWEQGEVYCSEITSRLLQYKFKFPEEKINILINNERTWITDTISVIAFDANHCPGAQIYLFQEYESKTDLKIPIKQIIHTGDFRSTDSIIEGFSNEYPIDSIYLDTTYLSHTNDFSLQNEIVKKTSNYVKVYFKKKDENCAKHRNFSVVPIPTKKLVLVGAYAIGKEKLAINIATQLGCKCFVYNKELRSHYMDCGDQTIDSSINVHLVPLGMLKSEETISKYLKEVVKVKWLDVMVVGVVPTGWTYGNMWESRNLTLSKMEKISVSKAAWENKNKDLLPENWFVKQVNANKKFQIFKVPYSEHSSFSELIRFATSGKFKWKEILATVNLENLDRARDMIEWFDVWNAINNKKFEDEMQ